MSIRVDTGDLIRLAALVLAPIDRGDVADVADGQRHSHSNCDDNVVADGQRHSHSNRSDSRISRIFVRQSHSNRDDDVGADGYHGDVSEKFNALAMIVRDLSLRMFLAVAGAPSNNRCSH